VLCFDYGWGARGVWAGLCIGLVLIGSMLLWTWERKTRHWTMTTKCTHS
jgi:Na+-driven multidrug efflux pump